VVATKWQRPISPGPMGIGRRLPGMASPLSILRKSAAGAPALLPGRAITRPLDFGAFRCEEPLSCRVVLVQFVSKVLATNEGAIFEAQAVAAKSPLQEALHAEGVPDQRFNLG
jgi:hypothetical protein